MSLDQLTEQAMQLPLASRAVLAEKLVESLDISQIDDLQKIWSTEAIRRRDEVRSGSVQPIPGDEVIEEVRRSIGQ